jgi:hypothetical protein
MHTVISLLFETLSPASSIRHRVAFYHATINGAIFNDPFSSHRSAPSEGIKAAWDTISQV